MDSSRQDHVRRLLAEAQSVPPEKRDAFLREHCDDEALREEVASLLAAQEEAVGFYEALADSVVAPMLRGLGEGGADASHADDSDPLGLEGEEVGGYVVEAHLGGGGMGIVYRARDPDLGRTVALKFLPPHLAGTEEAEKRFVREARAAAALEHSNVGTIHEIGRTGEGRRYIVMTYYEGETLKEKLEREGPLPVEEALGYAAQIAAALARAHEAQVVHRDVKPANVMITEGGEGKLLDFGLARLAEASRLTGTGQQLGTVGYMSPEQVKGEEVGPAADQWALGAVLYEMITGERPFQGERRAAVLHAVAHEALTPVQAHRPDVSPECARVVERCLQKDPSDRYESTERLAADLRALRAGEAPTGAVPAAHGPPPTDAGDRRGGRSRWIVTAAAALLALGLAALGWLAWPGGEAPADTGRSVAVLPFEVSGAGAETWRDGMVTTLSLNLDGAAGLRAIPGRRIFAAARQVDSAQVERDPALEVARAVGATYAVVGSAVQLGEELRLAADVRRARSGERLGQVEVEGPPGNVTALTDELTRKVLGVLLDRSEEAIPSVDLASRTTTSLPALKAYLNGERHRRAGKYAEAIEDFEIAVSRDSTFALAYMQLAGALGWRSQNQAAGRAWKRAYKHSDRLPRRERRITRAIHLWWNRDHEMAAADTVRRLSEVYPDDPRVWNLLGEIIFHNSIPGGWPEAERAFQKAVALDPDVAAYHHHLVEMAISLHHDRSLAVERLRAHPGEGQVKQLHRLAIDLVFGTGKEQQAAFRGLDTLDTSTIREHHFAFSHPADGGVMDSVLRRLDRREPGDGLFTTMRLAHYLERGQIEAAITEFPDEAQSACRWAFSLSLGYPVPDSLLRPLEPPQVESLGCASIYLVETGRPGDVDPLLVRLRDTLGQEGESERSIEALTNELRGYRAWKNGDLKQAETLLSKKNRAGDHGALWRGDLSRELGQLRAAEDWYMAAWEHPVAHERLGSLYEEMGRPEDAAEAYKRFIAAWKNADPVLQDRVDAARRRLRGLSGEGSGE